MFISDVAVEISEQSSIVINDNYSGIILDHYYVVICQLEHGENF